MTKTVSIILALLVGMAIGATLPSTQAQTSADSERTVWYFYRVKWS